MLSKSRRLRAADVENVLRHGSNSRALFLTAKAIHMSDGTIRIAAVVPKSVAPRAVDRNRLRRALYSAAGAYVQERRECGAHIIFFVRRVPPPPMAGEFRKDVAVILASVCKEEKKIRTS